MWYAVYYCVANARIWFIFFGRAVAWCTNRVLFPLLTRSSLSLSFSFSWETKGCRGWWFAHLTQSCDSLLRCHCGKEVHANSRTKRSVRRAKIRDIRAKIRDMSHLHLSVLILRSTYARASSCFSLLIRNTKWISKSAPRPYELWRAGDVIGQIRALTIRRLLI